MRFSWNVIPSTSSEARKTVIPVAVMYTPIHAKPDLAVLPYDPVVCTNGKCKAIMNPYCLIDIGTNFWVCRMCGQRNRSTYTDVTPDNLPLELQPGNTTVEYILQKRATAPPIFVFVVDTCHPDRDNFQTLKDSLLVSLSLLPADALICLITFGTNVYVHELSYVKCGKMQAFNGSKSYEPKQIQQALGFLTSDPRLTFQTSQPAAGRYLLSVEEAEFQMTKALEVLLEDPFHVPAQSRHLRATGVAINIALSLLEIAYPHTGSRIFLFAAGPCTIGPGTVVSPHHKETIRSHHDIANKLAPHYKKAFAYYDKLAKRASVNSTAVDIFGGCYDQIGLAEMIPLANSTGGIVVLADAFSTSIFKQSFQRVFRTDIDGYLRMGLNANLEVKMSRELRVSGIIGSVVGLRNKTNFVSETEVGIGMTSSWKLGSLIPSSTIAVYFDVVSNKPPVTAANVQPPQAFIQFITHYQHMEGNFRLRVTTVARALSIPGQAEFQKQSFDAEAAAAIITRLAMYKASVTQEAAVDIIRWIDVLLIKLCVRFGEYVKDDPNTFKLSSQLGSFFPQFMYHLRRGQFLQVFNNSPDETAFHRHTILVEGTTNTTIIIQPTLISYELPNITEGIPVLLDSSSVTADRILLLDTFFHILIFLGQTVMAWKDAGYQDQEEYANFKALLQLPRTDATELLVERFPLPRFIDTWAGASQARFLMARLNPSRSLSAPGDYTNNGGETTILTDDVSLQEFMAQLIKYSVATRNQSL